jgi:DNA primase
MTHRAEIARIKAQVRIEEVCRSRGIDLRLASVDRLEGLCPFHDDHTPSFSVYLQTQRYYCFACGAGGDVIDFIRTLERCSLLEALQRLVPAGRTGQIHVRPPRRTRLYPARSSQTQPAGDPSEEQRSYVPLLTSALAVYHQMLLRTAPMQDYLASRGLSVATMQRCMLGYADGTTFRRSLVGDAQHVAQAQQAGVLTRHGQEWLTGRVIIPDLDGERCTWMIGRVPASPLHPACKANDKYLGLPLPKPLLGYHQALACLREPLARKRLQHILVVEGAMDYLIAHEWQLPVLCVALLGTHASQQQLQQLLHLHTVSALPLLLWLDADERGREGTMHLLKHLTGRPVSLMPEMALVKDLADLGAHPSGYTRLQQAWHTLGNGGAQ